MSGQTACYLLGVDVGTQGTKGVLVSLDGDVVARYSFEHTISFPRPGWAEHDADRIWWQGFVRAARALLSESTIDPEQIAAIGVSAVCPVMVPVDGRGLPLRPGILYGIDTRSGAEIAWLNKELGWDQPSVPLSRRLTAQSVSPKVIWFRDNEPKRWEKTHKILGSTGYIVHRLTDAYVIDSGTVSALVPFFSPTLKDWDASSCERLGVPVSVFPEIREPADVVGTVSGEAAEETGLAVGTPVICGCCDAPAEYLSAGVVDEGDAGLLYGTTMCLTLLTAEPHSHPRLWGGKGLIPGLHTIGGGMASTGALTRWFRDQFGQEELRAQERLGINAYHLLSDEASQVPPGSEGLVVLPYFAGERTPIHDGEARGLILGLTIYHTRRHIYRAMLEGTAYGLRQHFEMMAEAGARPKRVVAAGGGSQDALWTQIVSDVTGLTQECLESLCGPPLGGGFPGWLWGRDIQGLPTPAGQTGTYRTESRAQKRSD